jgi:multicomponent Na+:H+ antiporter subunit G
VNGELAYWTAVLIEGASWLLLVSGSLFCMIGGIGMLRMPDFYSRGHAASVTDTMGAGLILFGLMLQGGMSLVTVKLAMVLFFLYVTSPTATHALVKAAYKSGLRAEGVPARAPLTMPAGGGDGADSR